MSSTKFRRKYTGLKDRNGKKIYEGNIVRSIHTFKVYDGSAFLEYSSLQFGAVYFSDRWVVNGSMLELYNMDKNTLEIIGNIYDDHELSAQVDICNSFQYSK